MLGSTEMKIFSQIIYELGRIRRRFSYYLESTYGYLMACIVARANCWNLTKAGLAHTDPLLLPQDVSSRLNYYVKRESCFLLSSPKDINHLLKERPTRYVLDFVYHLRRYPRAKVSYVFGDVTEVPAEPSFVKSRPIEGLNENAILFKLDKYRHFFFANDNRQFSQKISKLVWRGRIHHGLEREKRLALLRKFFNNPRFDVAHVNRDDLLPMFKGRFLSVPRQLEFKYVMSLEGVDVATNLKWVMSSNSLCFSPKLRYETWFMEGKLVPGVHFVEVRDDFDDLEQKLDFFEANPDEALKIIKNANAYVSQFLDKDREDLLCKLVLERYLDLSNEAS